MKPHPRIRKTIKWGGLAATMLLAVIFIVSVWCLWELKCGRYVMSISSGSTDLRVDANPNLAVLGVSLFHFATYSRFDWFFFHFAQRGAIWGFVFPAWLPIPIVLAPTVLAWWLDSRARRRADPTRCSRCHYDRTGLPGGAGAVCPECGSPPPVSPPPPPSSPSPASPS